MTAHPIKRGSRRVVVRPMRVEDISEVYHLGERIYNVGEAPLLYRTWDPYEVAAQFAAETELSIVATVSGRLVGFCLSTTIEKPGKPWRYGYLIWLGVDPSYRLRHVGRKLAQRTLRLMKQRRAQSILVDTPEDNRGAINFFERQGYRRRPLGFL